MMPLFFTFTAFFANGGKGWYSQKIPMAMVIMLLGTILWWIGLSRHDTEKRELNNPPDMGLALQDALDNLAFKNNMSPFVTMGGFSYMKDNAVAIVFPIALASFIETIENVEMASIVGDSYNVKEAMLADGCGTIVGALFGSVIPTTVYIGHKRHKVAGAHYFYSVLNALAYFILLLSGLMPFFFYSIDEIAISCILIAVGLMIVEQALEASVPRHYPCLMIGIMFLIADMLYFDHFDATVRVATRSIGRMKGVMNMAPGGGIMCSLIVPAILCDLIDARFGRAAIFCTIACIFSLFGIMHGANYHQPDGMMILPWAPMSRTTTRPTSASSPSRSRSWRPTNRGRAPSSHLLALASSPPTVTRTAPRTLASTTRTAARRGCRPRPRRAREPRAREPPPI